MGKKRALVVSALAMAGVMFFVGPALAATMLAATMSGAAEVPGPGDPDGSGTADLTLLPKRERICYTITVQNIGPATAAHIHRGTSTEAGPIIKELRAPSDGSSSGCVRSSLRLIKKIKTNPSRYYVNVHNDDFPNGALRGQLTE